MSDSNKLGPSGPPSPNQSFLSSAESQLAANLPTTPFSINPNQQQQQQQNNSTDDSSSQATKDQQKKDRLKKAQDQEAQKAKEPVPFQETKKPSPFDTGFAKKEVSKSAEPKAQADTQPAPTEKKQPSPFSLVGERKPTGEKAPPSDQMKAPEKTPETPKPQPTPAAKGEVVAGQIKTGQEGAQRTAGQTQQTVTKAAAEDHAMSSTTVKDNAQQAATLSSAQSSAATAGGQINAQTTANAQQSRAQTTDTTQQVGRRVDQSRTATSEQSQEWKYKQKLTEKADVKDNRLDEKYVGQQIGDQIQARTDGTSPTAVPQGTGTDIAQRAADILKTQDDFINLVASVATNEKQTLVQLKDGTQINVQKTDAGLDIAVTTPDSRVHSLVFNNRTSITKALSEKNIKVANLQVSMETSTGRSGPKPGVGQE